MTNADRYPAQVFWSEDDEGYIAIATDLPGCSAFGESREDAISSLLSAIEAWINAAKSAGNAVPEPSRPAERSVYSGKILLRIPKDLHGRLAQSAEEEGVSLNQYMVYTLARSQAERAVKATYLSAIRDYASVFVPQIIRQMRDVTPPAPRELSLFSVDRLVSAHNTSTFYPTPSAMDVGNG